MLVHVWSIYIIIKQIIIPWNQLWHNTHIYHSCFWHDTHIKYNCLRHDAHTELYVTWCTHRAVCDMMHTQNFLWHDALIELYVTWCTHRTFCDMVHTQSCLWHYTPTELFVVVLTSFAGRPVSVPRSGSCGASSPPRPAGAAAVCTTPLPPAASSLSPSASPMKLVYNHIN